MATGKLRPGEFHEETGPAWIAVFGGAAEVQAKVVTLISLFRQALAAQLF